jgi:hypothetical protein
MAETAGPALPSLRVFMMALPEMAAGIPRVDCPSDMKPFHCRDKLDNFE